MDPVAPKCQSLYMRCLMQDYCLADGASEVFTFTPYIIIRAVIHRKGKIPRPDHSRKIYVMSIFGRGCTWGVPDPDRKAGV